MTMNRRLIRRIAILLIALLGFAQGSVALATCTMDRGTLVHFFGTGESSGCDMHGMDSSGTLRTAEPTCETYVKASGPQHANRCIAHCTADLQLGGSPIALVRGPADTPALLTPLAESPPVSHARFPVPPPTSVPRRILLHSFLI